MANLSEFPILPGRILSGEEANKPLDWDNYYYWIDSRGPLVIISQQNKLVEYKQITELVDNQNPVPEPNFALVIFVLFTGLFIWLGSKRLD